MCSFTFISLRNGSACRVSGIERTWDYLKSEFNRDGNEIDDLNVRYFETIGPGPQLFAATSSTVYYHHGNQWFHYQSAFDIVFSSTRCLE